MVYCIFWTKPTSFTKKVISLSVSDFYFYICDQVLLFKKERKIYILLNFKEKLGKGKNLITSKQLAMKSSQLPTTLAKSHTMLPACAQRTGIFYHQNLQRWWECPQIQLWNKSSRTNYRGKRQINMTYGSEGWNSCKSVVWFQTTMMVVPSYFRITSSTILKFCVLRSFENKVMLTSKVVLNKNTK